MTLPFGFAEGVSSDDGYIRYMLARLNRCENLDDAKTIGRALYVHFFGDTPQMEENEPE